jgi:hypothetical protein
MGDDGGLLLAKKKRPLPRAYDENYLNAVLACSMDVVLSSLLKGSAFQEDFQTLARAHLP